MWIRAQARPSFCFMPPESLPARRIGEPLEVGEGEQPFVDGLALACL